MRPLLISARYSAGFSVGQREQFHASLVQQPVALRWLQRRQATTTFSQSSLPPRNAAPRGRASVHDRDARRPGTDRCFDLAEQRWW
jgi:hypothetical protein